MKKRGQLRPVAIWIAIGMLYLMTLFGQASWWIPETHADANDIPPVAEGWVEVSTPEQLIYIDTHQEDYLNQQIRLKEDIRLPSGTGWIPLGGNGKHPFSGTFDGRGHRISGITMTGISLQHVGFFGHVTGKVRNVGVEVAILSGEGTTRDVSTGGLVGLLDSGGGIEHAYSLGQVMGGNGVDYSSTGGLVGGAKDSTITFSSSSARVTGGSANNMFTGGLVGAQGEGVITDSFVTGEVYGPQSWPDVSYIHIGNFVGFMVYGTIEKSYAAGTISVTSVPNTYRGGFVGDLFVKTEITNSFFDVERTGEQNGIGAHSESITYEVYGKRTAEMKQAATFLGWDFTSTWTTHEGVNQGYPYMRPVILTSASDLPKLIVGVPYTMRMEAMDSTGGRLTWQASGLPRGLTLNSEGMLEGSPNESGTFEVNVTATGAGMASTTITYRLSIDTSQVPQPDTTPPTRIELTPADDATGVAIDTNLVLTFSEGVKAVPGKMITVKRAADDTAVERADAAGEQVSISGKSVTVDLYQNLAYDTTYYVVIEPGSFTDDANNAYAGISDHTDWTFTTLAPPLPPSGGGGEDHSASNEPPRQVMPPPQPVEKPPYIRGYADGTFRPDRPIRRAELAMMLWRLQQEEAKSQPITGQKNPAYHDVEKTYWAYQAIASLLEQGILRGVREGFFQPESFVTRGEFAAAVLRWRGIEEDQASAVGSGKQIDFKDIHDHWAEKAISTLAGYGVVQGYPDGSFRPDDRITRAEVVKIINLLTGRGNIETAGEFFFTDVPLSHWAYGEILVAARKVMITRP